MLAVVQQRNVSEAIRSLSTMESPDYVDVFTVASGVADRSQERWGPYRGRRRVPLGSGGRLEGALRPASRVAAVAGAPRRVEDRRSRRQLDQDGGELMVHDRHIVFHVDEGCVSFATFVCYDNPVAALVWPAVSIVHRRAVPGLLRAGVKRLSR